MRISRPRAPAQRVGCIHRLAMAKVGRKYDEPFTRQALAEIFAEGSQAPPGMKNEDTRAFAGCGQSQVLVLRYVSRHGYLGAE